MTCKLTVLLLGSGGFIGHNLKDQLPSYYTLITPHSHELDLTNEVAVEKYLKRLKPDTIVDASACGGSRKNPNLEYFLNKNLRIFYNLVRQEKYFGKLIHFGSGAEYDKSQAIINAKEGDFDRRIPKDYYGFYKYICSKYIASCDKIICLRPFGVYGKYEDYSIRFVSYAICCTLFNMPIKINQNLAFDYIYVNDLVKIVIWFIDNQPKHKFYNLGRGKVIELLTIAHKVVKLFNNKTEIVVKKPGMGKQYSCNIDRLLNELPQIKFTSFKQSLIELHSWYKQNIKKIDQKSLYFDQ